MLPMSKLRDFIAFGLACTIALPGLANAQEGEAAVPPASSVGHVAPSYLEYRRAELAHLAGRSRVALISTSAGMAAGIALVTPALVGQCVRVASSSSFDDLRCNTTGKTLLGVGMPLLVAGATGVLITAIMYGVRRGKMRNIDQQLLYDRHHARRWDVVRSAIVF
jgi:hypothetical protein